MAFKVMERWLLPGFKVYKENFNYWEWVATFRTRGDADRYVMNLNGVERGT